MRMTLPHSLDRAEVRRRLDTRTPELAGYIPGGMAQVDHQWTGQDRMRLGVRAMGQSVTTHIDIEDDQVVVTVDLPGQLAFFGGLIEKAVRDKGTKLLR